MNSILLVLVLNGAAAEVRAKTLHEYAAMGTPYTNLAAPDKSLGRNDVSRWRTILALSNDQAAFVDAQYLIFIDRHNSFLDQNAPKYLANCSDASSDNSPTRMRNLYEGSRRLWGDLERLEYEFIDSFVPVLTEEQSDRLQILRNEASRRQHRNFVNPVRWASVELRHVWDESPQDELSETQVQAVDAILEDYENRTTPLVRRQCQAYWSTSVEFSSLFERLNRGEISPAEFHSLYGVMQGRCAETGRRIRQITEETTKAITDSLPQPVAESFVGLVKNHVFPELYPDSNDLHEMFRNLQNDSVIDQGVKDLTVAFYTEFDFRYTSACKELESFCVDWGDNNARGISGFQAQFLQPSLEPLLAKRIDVSQQCLAKLRAAIGEELVQSHMPRPPKPQNELPTTWD